MSDSHYLRNACAADLHARLVAIRDDMLQSPQIARWWAGIFRDAPDSLTRCVYCLPKIAPLWVEAASLVPINLLPKMNKEPRSLPAAITVINGLIEAIERAAATSPGIPATPANGLRVVLRGRSEGPRVLGREKQPLSQAQYDVVKALLDADGRGLSKDELDRKSGHGDARKILKRLADADPDWAAVIHCPGKTGGGYRIG
jgi:hypothetical protein